MKFEHMWWPQGLRKNVPDNIFFEGGGGAVSPVYKENVFFCLYKGKKLLEILKT